MSFIERVTEEQNDNEEKELLEKIESLKNTNIESIESPKPKQRRKYTVSQKRLESLQKAREAKRKKKEDSIKNKEIDDIVEQRVKERLQNMNIDEEPKKSYTSKPQYDLDILDIIK